MTGKILVVDPVATNRIILKAKLSAAYYDTAMALDAASGLAAALAEEPDLIMIAAHLPGDQASDLCVSLRGRAAFADTPILAFADGPSAQGASCLLAGADDLFERGLGDAALFARLRTLLRQSSMRRELADRLTPSAYEDAARILWDAREPVGTIGWISSDRAGALGWQARLTALGLGRTQIIDPTTVLGRAQAAPAPDLYVIDHPSNGNKLDLLGDLGARDHSRHAATLVIQSISEGQSAAAAFDLGVASVVTSRTDPAELAARLTAVLRRKRQGDRLRAAIEAGLDLALKDPLTDLQNRRGAFEALARMGASTAQTALVMIDIDHFKSVNDRFGHAMGDAVLVAVAKALRQSLPDAQVLGRIGGEEFLVAFDIDAHATATALADQARRNVAALRIETQSSTLSVTVSAGVAVQSSTEDINATLARADAALYAAKSQGRNRVFMGEGLPA